MNDENLAPQEAQAPADDDLLNWMPPELVERARYTAEKDAKTFEPKKRRLNLVTPPAGKRKKLSLAALLCGVLLLAANTVLSATGANGQLAVMQKSRLWFALWMTGQAAMLCVYLLSLLPLSKEMRRPALLTVLGTVLIANSVSGIIVSLRQEGDFPLAFLIGMIVFSSLLILAFSPELWLMLGVLRGKTTEKLSAMMGSVILLISLIMAKRDAAAYLSALKFVQGLCYVTLLFSWPVLERPVLSKPTEGEASDGQPE